MQEHKTDSGAVGIEGGRESQNRQASKAQSVALSRRPASDHKLIEEHQEGDPWMTSGGDGREATATGQRVASAIRIRRPLQGRSRGT